MTVTISPDETPPTLSFSPDTLALEGSTSGDATLTATDDVAITSGPDVSCTNGGSFADGVFQAPQVTSRTTSVCTATAGDAAGNTGEAALTVTITPQTSESFRNISDTVETEPVLGLVNLSSEPDRLLGLTKASSGTSVSNFTALTTGTGTFDDAIVTAQPSLGSLEGAPLDIFFADIEGLSDSGLDPIFIDEGNEDIVGVTLNADGSYGLPTTRNIPGACDMGRGGSSRFIGSSDEDALRFDSLVGTRDGLFYVAIGFPGNGSSERGFAPPSSIVGTGNFCNLIVGVTGIRDMTYVVYDPDTATVKGFEGSRDDAASYEEQFSVDLSENIGVNTTPLLFEGVFRASAAQTIVAVFDNAETGGSTLAYIDVGVTPETNYIDLDLENPTDLEFLRRGGATDAIIVSPTSQYAVYILNIGGPSESVEVIDIGLGFDQVAFAAGGIAFASSTQDNIVVRSLR